MSVYERIEQLCKERKVSKRKLSLDLGLNQSTVSKWKDHDPTSDKIKKVADYFDVSVAYLMGETDVQKNVQPTYYNEPMTVKKAEALLDKQRTLMAASADLTEESIDLLIAMANQLKGTNRDG